MGTTRRKSGFTIVELIVVISVIAILVAIVIVSYGAWQKSIQTTAVKSDLTAVAALMEDIRNAPGSEGYPGTLDPDPDFDSSQNVLITFPLKSITEYCVNGTSTQDATIQYYVYSRAKDKGAIAGTCGTRADLTPPATPLSVNVSSTDSVTATVSWLSVSDATSYIAQCATDGGFIYNPRQITVAAGSGTIQGVVTGLSASGSPYCRVKAINSKGGSLWSAIATNGGSVDGLVAKWTFNGNANDIVGNAEGVVSGAVATTGQNGITSGAYNFNGSSNFINMGTGANYNTPEFSVGVWAKADLASQAHVTNLVGKGSWNGSDVWYIGFKQGTSLSFDYGLSFWNDGPTYPLSSFNVTQWHHYVGTANTTQQKLYLDGNLVSTVTLAHNPVANTFQLQVGRSSYADIFFDGTVDDIRIYNKALTQTEITALFNAGAE